MTLELTKAEIEILQDGIEILSKIAINKHMHHHNKPLFNKLSELETKIYNLAYYPENDDEENIFE